MLKLIFVSFFFRFFNMNINKPFKPIEIKYLYIKYILLDDHEMRFCLKCIIHIHLHELL